MPHFVVVIYNHHMYIVVINYNHGMFIVQATVATNVNYDHGMFMVLVSSKTFQPSLSLDVALVVYQGVCIQVNVMFYSALWVEWGVSMALHWQIRFHSFNHGILGTQIYCENAKYR
jgi:hypothetical protein